MPRSNSPNWPFFPGFTLAELLIALAILGVIATFTIPKILSAQANQARLSAAKEVAAALSGAYTQYKLNVGVTPNVSYDYDMLQYLNYVKRDTASQVDEYPLFSGTLACSNTNPCYRLHNGGLLYAPGQQWDATNSTNAVFFIFDADGVITNNNDSVDFAVYYDGAIRSRQTLKDNTDFPGGQIRGPQAGGDPTWFNW